MGKKGEESRQFLQKTAFAIVGLHQNAEKFQNPLGGVK